MSRAYDLDQQLKAAQDRLSNIIDQISPQKHQPIMTAAFYELSIAMEELHVATEELHQQHEELLASQQALLEERQRYQNLFDLAPHAYVVTNGDGIIGKANQAAEALLNVRRDLLLNKPINLYINREDHPFIFELLEVAQGNGSTPNPATPSQVFNHTQSNSLVQGREITLNPRSQASFPASLSLTLEYDAEGNPTQLLWLFQDIRELKRHEAERQQAIAQRLAAQEAYIQNERRYQQILNAIPDLIFVKDRNSRLVWANQALQDFYGMTLEELQGVVDAPFSNAELTRQYRKDDAVVLNTGATLHILEESIVRHDGTVQSFTTVKSPIRNDQGEVTELVGICRDMTQRLQAEMQLRQSEEKFRHFAENSQVVIWMTRPNLLEGTYVNPAYERVWGRSRQSLIDNPESWLEAIYPEDRERVHATMGTQLPKQLTTAEYRIIRPDGTIRWIRDHGFAMRNEAGEVYGFGGLAEDITDKKQLELSLAASEAQKSQILNSVVASLVSLRVYQNQDFEYDFYSDGCKAIYGYSAAELTTDKQLWLSRLDPEDRDAFLDKAFKHIFAEQSFTAEFRFHHKDGSIRWIASTHTSKKIAEDCWQVTAANYDITQRKQAQELLEYQIQREQLVASVTQDIRQSLELQQVLSRTVKRVCKLLQTDRVVIFQFKVAPGGGMQGEVIMEALRHGTPSILHEQLDGPCFEQRYIEPYQDGRITVIEDSEHHDINPCYQELLRQLQVKANLVAPLQHQQHIWGLLVAHQCSEPRQWQDSEIDLMKQIADQVSIAIQQSELYEQARKQLLEIETIYNTAPVGLASLDTDLRFVRVNQYLANTNGVPAAEHLGHSILEVMPELAPQLKPYINQVLETGEPVLHVEVSGETAAQPGVKRTWLESWIPLLNPDQEVLGINLVALEITKRKAIDAKLREQAALLDISSDAIFVRDLDHRILYWNRGAEAMYGWTAAEAIGQKVDTLLRCNTDRLAEITQELVPQGTWQGEIQDFTKAGKPLSVLARWTLVRNDAGEPESILSVITDITERKRLEQQFYQAQRLEALGTLTGGMAHDLNNVLSPILAMAQLLRMTQQQLSPQAQEQLQLIEQSAKRGAAMIKQILTLTRGSTEDPTPVKVWPVLQEATALIQESFPQDITVSLVVPPRDAMDTQGLTVMADATYLHQVVMNLCVNARDAMPQGGQLTLSATRVQIDTARAALILEAEPGDYVEITITDTGSGIAPEVRDHVFDPFFTTKASGKGTGLGLAMVRGIVQNYGGFVLIDSEVERGTQVQVYLPALGVDAQDHPSPTPLATTPIQGQGAQVLVVEDDQHVQLTTRSLLETHDYIVSIANNGEEALEVYRQHQNDIQLVLLDITMPGMSGIELIERLKQLNPAVKVVAISGLAINRRPSLQAGASAFLGKPYGIKQLLSTIEQVIQADSSSKE
jgi:PAS domain S-box-containing protein